ncbi:MAG: T9SS type A sorting domain-containing protein, partial [Candidatus Marinimicrobia bacterium]|nr:T9SS type A sorting domain-containing protein [Candidatus Neomarinimicrobiota bacterium]
EMISRRTMPVSQPPVVTAIDDITIDEDDDKTLYITATDADGDSLTYSATADTSAIVVMVGALSDNELYVSPLMNWNGSSVVTVAVSDGFSTVEESFTLTVNPTPDPPSYFTWTNPTVENDSIIITSSNQSYNWSIGWENSTDPDGEDVTYMIFSTLPPFNTVPIPLTEKANTTDLTLPYQFFIDNWPSDLQMVNRLTYVYNVFAYSGNDSTEITGTRQLVVKREGDLNTESIEPPNSFVLHPNYPNPFNPQTQIRFEMPYAGKVDLSIYNLLGVKIKTLYSGQKPTGVYTFKWDGKNESSQLVSGGVYIYKLQSAKGMQMRKMILLK